LRAFKNVAANDAQKQKWQNVIDKTYQVYHEMYNNSCYAQSILSSHHFKLLPSNLVRSKD
jgi:hypothetical protein